MRNVKVLLIAAFLLLFSLSLAAQPFCEGCVVFSGSSSFSSAKAEWSGAPGPASMFPVLSKSYWGTYQYLSHVVVRQSSAWETPTNYVNLRAIPIDAGGASTCPQDVLPNCTGWDLSSTYHVWFRETKADALSLLNILHPLQQPWTIGPIELVPQTVTAPSPVYRFVVLTRDLNVR